MPGRAVGLPIHGLPDARPGAVAPKLVGRGLSCRSPFAQSFQRRRGSKQEPAAGLPGRPRIARRTQHPHDLHEIDPRLDRIGRRRQALHTALIHQDNAAAISPGLR